MNLLLKKRMRNAGWLSLAAVGAVLLVAGVSRKNNKECKNVKVEVTGANKHIFIDEKEVLKFLNANGNLVGMPVDKINLQVLEDRLENDKWIKSAELFFNNSQVLEVEVEEREPVARIFTTEGNSYYIDSSASRLPLSDKMSIRVPMFTNFPTNAKKLRSKDSALMVSVKKLATFIQADSFWNAQVAQVNITPNRTFEMVPTIGNQIILLGKGDDIEKKFERLFSFYKQVWTKVGLEKYSVIDVQYKGQVVASRRGADNINIDSSRAREAFFKLLDAAKPDATNDETVKAKSTTVEEKSATRKDEAIKTANVTKKVKSETASVIEDKRNANDKKGEADKKTTAKTSQSVNSKQTASSSNKKPKAVLTKKTK